MKNWFKILPYIYIESTRLVCFYKLEIILSTEEHQPIRNEASPIGSYGCVTDTADEGLLNEQRL